jgi:hypothetical protein
MKTMLSSRKHRYLAKFSIFLITAALIAGMVGCDRPIAYDLTISISSTAGGIPSTAGGNVTAIINEEVIVISLDGEKTKSDIPEETVVDLVATPDTGYRFDSWIGKVADVNAATTTITMSGRYSTISITAKFVEGKEIRNWYHLDDIRNNLRGNHVLMNALNATTDGWEELASQTAKNGTGWQPFGTFTGTFDGQGHEVRDLFIYRPGRDKVGLFGHVGEGGVVKNVAVVNANVTGDSNVGGLVGWNDGTVKEKSYYTGSVTGNNEHIGGLVGRNQGTVSSSNFTGTVKGNNNNKVGGLVGYNKGGSVTNSHAIGSVNGGLYVGGLVGYNEGGSVKDSHFSGNVTGSENVGGLVGRNQDTVSNSYSTGSVSGNDYIGGLVGWNDGTVSKVNNSTGNVNGEDCVGGLVGYNHNGTVDNSHSSANVTGNKYVGGLVGENQGTVNEKCYFTGSVTGEERVGGLVGYNNLGDVSKSYSTGSVTGLSGSTYIGGLVGYNEGLNEAGSVSNSYSWGGVTGSSAVGGLVGLNNKGTVSNSYSTGSVTGNARVGGLVGKNDGTIEKSYSTGNVNSTAGGGGLVGDNSGSVDESFWDTQTSGQTTSNDGTPKTTTDMQKFATFLGADWDIIEVANRDTRDDSEIWNIADETYPFLSWEPI